MGGLREQPLTGFYALSNHRVAGGPDRLPYPGESPTSLSGDTIAGLVGWVRRALPCSAALLRHFASRANPPSAPVAASPLHPDRELDSRILVDFAGQRFPQLRAAVLATTNPSSCQNVASIPFLWVAPLAAYLLSLILCFDYDSPRRHLVFLWLTPPALIAAWATSPFSRTSPPIFC